MKKVLVSLFAAMIATAVAADTGPLTIRNEKVECTVVIVGGRLVSDRLAMTPEWTSASRNDAPVVLETDADFALDLMFTNWQAPGRADNADNPVLLRKDDFAVSTAAVRSGPGGADEIVLELSSTVSSIEMEIVYRLDPDAFFARRFLAVRDTKFGHHFLRWLWTRDGAVSPVQSVVKAGGFGQPVALALTYGGAFFGLEYPTAENHYEDGRLRAGQEIGSLIGDDWVRGDAVVEAVTPDDAVKLWFFRYLDTVRVVPLRPYTLYNTWYDLRSPEYPNVPPENVMSEDSAIRMAGILREKMIERYGIVLDAFVLDDGWDIYASDWERRSVQWPRGFKPLSDELEKTDTRLGVWIGPTGGYSLRMDRVEWMRDHGYEVVGRNRNDAMLCVAGEHYSALLQRRVADFVTDDGVGYFKWDGFQFSCSEPDHGHPIGIYSRRAVMESTKALARIARGRDPEMFLNITSGTWLSPWWVTVANTIWMQGMDYGYSDVPSISKRDAAITYRDFILYDDFRNLDRWFPIANLMTHGIIKGKLQLLGSAEEPLDKFTDDVLLYVARGISMFELYVSPDILSDGEWRTMSGALAWARNRFPILMSTTMTGGNPMNREAYAWAHFKDAHGIVAARNPFVTATSVEVVLDPREGFDSEASSLVLERLYPTRWIAPSLYSTGDRIELPLDGYETSIWEIYPLVEAREPLVAGATFDVTTDDGTVRTMTLHGDSMGAKILNPSTVNAVRVEGEKIDPTSTIAVPATKRAITGSRVAVDPADRSRLTFSFDLATTARDVEVAVLLNPDEGVDATPSVSANVDGAVAVVRSENQRSRSRWFIIPVEAGSHTGSFAIGPDADGKPWRGTASVWMVGRMKQETVRVSLDLDEPPATRILPPRVWEPGEVRLNVRLGDAALSVD